MSVWMDARLLAKVQRIFCERIPLSRSLLLTLTRIHPLVHRLSLVSHLPAYSTFSSQASAVQVWVEQIELLQTRLVYCAAAFGAEFSLRPRCPNGAVSHIAIIMRNTYALPHHKLQNGALSATSGPSGQSLNQPLTMAV